jgi:hypothetical protein
VLEVVSETVTEEVVDFEEWMVDQAAVAQGRRQGVSIVLHGGQLGSLRDLQSASTEQARSLLLLLQHPELLGASLCVFCEYCALFSRLLISEHKSNWPGRSVVHITRVTWVFPPMCAVTEEDREEDDIDALAAEQVRPKPLSFQQLCCAFVSSVIILQTLCLG